MDTLIIKLAKGENITDVDLENELEEICERVHSSCDYSCPVYSLNGGRVPNQDDSIWNCDTFRNGRRMLEFIRKKA